MNQQMLDLSVLPSLLLILQIKLKQINKNSTKVVIVTVFITVDTEIPPHHQKNQKLSDYIPNIRSSVHTMASIS